MLKKLNHILIILLGFIWLLGSATKIVLACGGASAGGGGAGGCQFLVDYCYDYDGDGYGNPALAISRCDGDIPPFGFVLACNDPDDNDENITPGS
jgi:hypothetical protein